MIENVRATPEQTEQAAKRAIEKRGYRSASYWIRHKRISADQLRKLAKEGHIDALTYEKGPKYSYNTTWYYTEEMVSKAISILWPKE